MAWEYLEEKDYRYEYVSEVLGELSGEVVLDFNSGNSRLKDYLHGDYVYKCNDLFDDRADYKITDEAFLEQEEECDILCCFGIGGNEITNEELESKTITKTLEKAIKKYKPKYVILESIKDFVGLTYIPISRSIFYYDCLPDLNSNGEGWLNNRVLRVYKRRE